MNHLEYTFRTGDLKIDPEVLIAFLSEAGYEGFNETAEELIVYIPVHNSNEAELRKLLESISPDGDIPQYAVKEIPEENWNAKWENSFNPVKISDQVCIRASFHPVDTSVKYDILIDPKMSFGTGHHETTRLMVNALLMLDLKGKKVLDMGSGTGILAILASLAGALDITAIDIDEWAYRNCVENVTNNGCNNIKVIQGDAGVLKNTTFDIILANINRNILLNDMGAYYQNLTPDGVLIVSGIMEGDSDVIRNAAENQGFKLFAKEQEGRWMAIHFKKTG